MGLEATVSSRLTSVRLYGAFCVCAFDVAVVRESGGRWGSSTETTPRVLRVREGTDARFAPNGESGGRTGLVEEEARERDGTAQAARSREDNHLTGSGTEAYASSPFRRMSVCRSDVSGCCARKLRPGVGRCVLGCRRSCSI